jgi:hypothetical protein
MLTAAGTVPVLHRIPFSFFAWEETFSAANVVECLWCEQLYLSNQFLKTIMIALRIGLLKCTCIVLCLSTSLQSQAQLSAMDSTQLAQIKIICALNEQQSPAVDSLFKNCSAACVRIDKEMNRVSRSGVSEEEKSQAQSALRAEKKSLRETRDMAVQFLLTPQQRALYDEKIKPAAPAILHMGMNHDRANCNVCVK